MRNFKFRVKGSEPQPYETNFYFDGKAVTGTCTCGAGSNGYWCNHRLSILRGDTSQITGGNKNEVEALLQVLKGTVLESKLQQFNNEEKEMEQLQKRFAATKREFSRLLLGQ